MDGVNDPVEEHVPRPEKSAHDEDGVDVSLIRWLLDMDYGDRLAVLQAQANSLAKLRDAASRN